MFVPPAVHTLRDGSAILLRTGIEHDAPGVMATVETYIQQNDGVLWSPGEKRQSVEETRAWVGGMLRNDSEVLLLAEQNNEIVGNIDFHIGARRRIRHTGEFGMGVAPNHRGRGIGGLLLDRVIRWARSNERIERVELHVISSNQVAIDMYRARGSTVEGTRPRHIRYEDGRYADDVLMGLDV